MELYEKGGYITEETFTSVTLRRNVGAPVKNCRALQAVDSLVFLPFCLGLVWKRL